MKMKGLFVGVLAVALTFGLSFGVMAEQGVTDTEIHIGQWGPQTARGPLGRGSKGDGCLFQDDQCRGRH